MLSAGLALESHKHNFVFPTAEPPTAQFHAHEIAATASASAETMCSSSSSSSSVVHENVQKKAQRNLQQHQLHAQFLHDQYLSQRTVSSASPASSSSSSASSASSPSPSLHSPSPSPSSSSTAFDLFGKQTFLPPSTAVLENWRNDLLFIASASDSFSHSRKTLSSTSNATCTITSGSFQSMKQPPFDVNNLTSNSTISEIDSNHKFLVPKVPNKTSVSSNRNSKKEVHHYSQQNQKNDQSPKITPSKNNECENVTKPSTTEPHDNHFMDQFENPNLKLTDNKNTLKIPSGKEGSLKHRILTSFSPEKEEVLDEPEDLSLKNVKPTTESYVERTKSCSISSVPVRLSSQTSPPPTSSTASSAADQQLHSEQKKRKRSIKIEFKQAHNFLKGLSIKLDTGTVRKIEEMTTDDLLQSIDLRPDLVISNLAITSMFADATDSTNNKINVVGHFSGSSKKKEISIKRSDPFFVYGTGWASYDPELTKSVYGADCKRLSAGDVIIMLKNKSKAYSFSSLPSKKAKIRRSETVPTPLSSAKLVAHTAEPNNNLSQNVPNRSKQKKETEVLNKTLTVETESAAVPMAEVDDDDDDCGAPTKKKKHLSPPTRNSYPGYSQNFHHPSQVSFDLQIQAQLLQQQQQQQQQHQHHDQQQQQQYHSPLFPHANAHFHQPFAYTPYAYHPYPLSYQQFYFPQTSITHHTHISNAISHETESNLK